MKTFFEGLKMGFSKMLRTIFGVPDGELSAGIENKPSKCEFIPESELHGHIEAAAADGESYVPWRTDADGEQWFRRVPTIEANADDSTAVSDELDDDVMVGSDNDFEDDDDDELDDDDDDDTDSDGTGNDDDDVYDEA